MSSPASPADLAAATDSAPFDPWHQTFKIVDSQGNELEVSMDALQDWNQYGIRIAIIWGSQIGASFIMLAMVLILTKQEKRRSLLFFFNVLSLILCIIRAVTNVLFFTTSWYNAYTVFATDYSRVPASDYATSILATTMTLLMIICIEVSLVIQANIVCTTVKRPFRIAIIALAGMFALTSIVIRFLLTVWSNMDTMGRAVEDWRWLPPWANITLCVSICYFSLVFCAKLGLAIRNRRRLGLKQFGPMQIIFIMGAQTLIIPSILSILEFLTPNVPELGSLVTTVVSICLPLSSLWATASTDGDRQASRGRNTHQKLLEGVEWRKYTGRRKSSHFSDHSAAPLKDAASPTSKKTISTYDTIRTGDTISSDCTNKTYVDLEKGNENQLAGTGAANGINKMFP